MLKWIVAALCLLLVGGAYYVVTRGGALEMQPEHAVEAPAQQAPAGGHK